MKKNIRELQRIGNFMNVMCLLALFIYIFGTIYFYIASCLYPDGLHASNKPLILYIIKWSYAIIMIYGFFCLGKKPQLGWFFLNAASICVLLLFLIIFMLSIVFYVSIIDMFLLELISLIVIILSNTEAFIKSNGIERGAKEYIIVIVIPIIITSILYVILLNYQIGNYIL